MILFSTKELIRCQKKLLILSLILLVLLPVTLHSQGKSAFSGDLSKFVQELNTFMGPNLNPEQHANINNFIARWDSAAFSKADMVRIIDISSQLSSRFMRPVPHFNDYLMTLNYFVTYKRDAAFFKNWMTGLSELAFNPRFTNDNIDRYFKNTDSMIRENVLYESGSVRWKVKNNNLKFLHDTVFYISISNSTLTCYSQKDSTEIYNVSGSYYPDIQLFRGTKGIITWEKAGYARKDVFAELTDYIINTSKSTFTIDSVNLTHSTYFKSLF